MRGPTLLFRLAGIVVTVAILAGFFLVFLNLDAQREQAALLRRELVKAQQCCAGGAASAPLRVATFDATTDAFFSAGIAGATQVIPVPPHTQSDAPIRLAVLSVVAAEAEGGEQRPFGQTVTLQPGVPVEVHGACPGPGTPPPAWIFSLENNALSIVSRACPVAGPGLRPRLRVTVVQ